MLELQVYRLSISSSRAQTEPTKEAHILQIHKKNTNNMKDQASIFPPKPTSLVEILPMTIA